MENQKLVPNELNIQSFVTFIKGIGDTAIHGEFSCIDRCCSSLIACYPIRTLALCPIRTLNICRSFLDACRSAISCPFDFEGLTIQ